MLAGAVSGRRVPRSSSGHAVGSATRRRALAVAKILGDGTRQRTQSFSELHSHYLLDDRFGRLPLAGAKLTVGRPHVRSNH